MGAPKYKFRYKEDVEVKIRQPNGRPPIWVRGYVKDLHGKGASVQVTEGKIHSDFFHWSDIRKLEQDPPSHEAKPMATLGEVIAPQLRAVPAPEPAQPEPQQKTAVLITREELETVQKRAKTASANVVQLPSAHEPKFVRRPLSSTSRIGRLIRDAREAQTMAQPTLMRKIATRLAHPITQTRMSNIETGLRIPTEDEALAFAEALGLDIDAVVEAREQDLRERPEATKPTGTRHGHSTRAKPVKDDEPADDEPELDKPVARVAATRAPASGASTFALQAELAELAERVQRTQAIVDQFVAWFAPLVGPPVPAAPKASKPDPRKVPPLPAGRQRRSSLEITKAVLGAARAWSSAATIAKCTGVLLATVQRTCARLVDERRLERRGSRHTYEYRRRP